MSSTIRSTVALCAFALLSASASAQISLSAAIDLALRNSPRLHMAQDDAAKALTTLQQTHDIYIPSLTGGAGLGEAYGYSPNPPTLFTLNAQGLVFSYSQFAYIRAARLGLAASHLALEDVREGVIADAALTFIAFSHDLQREQVLSQEMVYAEKLVNIVSDRVSAGFDTQIDLTQARLSLAQFRLAELHAQNDIANDRDRLALLTGLPPASLRVEPGFPSPPPSDDLKETADAAPGIASSFANASARQQTAIGDARFLYRPQFSLIVQYNRYATFTNSFQQLESLYGRIGSNEQIYAVQISVPLFDKYRQAKARETLADASHALHDAQNNQFLALDGQFRLRRSIAELQARDDVAVLEQQLSQQQLEVLLIQLNAPQGNGPQMTPKDEQNSRIGERQKFLALIDARRQMLDAEVNLLRQTGRLEAWLRSAQIQPQIQSQAQLSSPPASPVTSQPAPGPASRP